MIWYDMIRFDLIWYVTQLIFSIQHELYCVPCWPNIVKINTPARCPSCINVKGAQSRQETFFLGVCFPRNCPVKTPSVLSVPAALANCEPTRRRQILRAPRYVASKCRGNCGGLFFFCFVVVTWKFFLFCFVSICFLPRLPSPRHSIQLQGASKNSRNTQRINKLKIKNYIRPATHMNNHNHKNNNNNKTN